MDSQRGALSKRDAIRNQEELMDLKLKEVGCWDEGLNINEKIKIIEFLKESETSQKCQSNVEDESAECEEKTTDQSHSSVKENQSFQKEDSPEPMIMYDSFTSKENVSSKQSESSSDDDFFICSKIIKNNPIAGQAASHSAERNNNVCYGKASNERSIINFDKVDKQAEMLDITGNSATETSSSSDIDNSHTENNQSVVTEIKCMNGSEEERPLRRKNMIKVDPSKVYYRNATETREECVNRILAMISEFHRQFKAYQKTLMVPIPWGPPITVDPEVQNPSASNRHLRSKNTVNSKKSDDIYDFNISATESSSEETNAKDSEWIQCNKRKAIKRNKRNCSPQLDANDSYPNSKKQNNQGLTDKDIESCLSEDKNGTDQATTSGAEASKRSVKRKTFSLQKTVYVRNELSEIEQPLSKKQKITSQSDGSMGNVSDSEEVTICPSPVYVVKKGNRYMKKPQPLQFVQAKPIEEPSVPSSNTVPIEIAHSSKDLSPISETPPEIELVPCPLCQKEFSKEKIEAHASDCMVDGSDLPLLRMNSEDDIVYLERQASI